MRFKCQMIGTTTLHASPPVGNERGALIKNLRLVERVKSAKTAESRHCCLTDEYVRFSSSSLLKWLTQWLRERTVREEKE